MGILNLGKSSPSTKISIGHYGPLHHFSQQYSGIFILNSNNISAWTIFPENMVSQTKISSGPNFFTTDILMTSERPRVLQYDSCDIGPIFNNILANNTVSRCIILHLLAME